MANKILYSETLILELYLIGYASQGESIVFLLKADGHIGRYADDVLLEAEVPRVDYVAFAYP